MAKQKYERTKPHANIGTIGHVDHGKTGPCRLCKKHDHRRSTNGRSDPRSIRSRRPDAANS